MECSYSDDPWKPSGDGKLDGAELRRFHVAHLPNTIALLLSTMGNGPEALMRRLPVDGVLVIGQVPAGMVAKTRNPPKNCCP